MRRAAYFIAALWALDAVLVVRLMNRPIVPTPIAPAGYGDKQELATGCTSTRPGVIDCAAPVMVTGNCVAFGSKGLIVDSGASCAGPNVSNVLFRNIQTKGNTTP